MIMLKFLKDTLTFSSKVQDVDALISSSKLSMSKSDKGSLDPFDSLNTSSRDIFYWYTNDPVIYGATNRVCDFTCSSGYDIKNDPNKELEVFFDKMSLPFFLRNATLNLQLFDNLFVDLRDTYPKILPTKDISILYDEYGNIVGYELKVDNQTYQYKAEQIAYIKMNLINSGLAGVSPIVPLKSYLSSKSKVETYNAGFFDRNGNPRFHYIVKSRNPEIRKAVMERIGEMRSFEDLITNEDVEVIPISQPISDAQFEKWVNYLNNLIIVALGTPDIIAGFSEGSNKATSRIQLQAFKYRVKAIQTCLANLINTQIIPKYFPKSDAYIVFRDIDKEDSNISAINRAKTAQAIAQYTKNGILTPEEAKKYAIDDLSNLQSDLVD